ncbi:response regulator transcription factor, partial [Gilvimarinus sp. 1_MG-2023]
HQHHPNQNALDIAERLASLTPQQFRVLTMMAEGMLNKQIAYDLEVSEATIKAHVTAIFRKLGVRTRTQAVIAVQSLDIEKPDTQMANAQAES